MPIIEEISKLSKNGCDDELLDYICNNYDEIECELNGKEYNEPKKCNRNLCVDCNMEMIIDYQKSTLVCTKCSSSIDFGIYLHAIFHSVFTFMVQSPQNLRSNPYNRKSGNGS